jgi:hypothetical protein
MENKRHKKRTLTGIKSKGFGEIAKLFMQDRRIPITAKSIYAYICSYTGDNVDSAYPGRNKICYDLNINKDTFIKYLKYLTAYGYIECKQRTEDGKFESNKYMVVNHPVEKKALIKLLENKKPPVCAQRAGKKTKNCREENPPCPKVSDTTFSDTRISDTTVSDTNTNSFNTNRSNTNRLTATTEVVNILEKQTKKNAAAVENPCFKNVLEGFCKITGKHPNSEDIRTLKGLLEMPLKAAIDLQTRENIILRTIIRISNNYTARNPGKKINSLKYFAAPIIDEFEKCNNIQGGGKNEQPRGKTYVTASGRKYDLSKFSN